jgi:hypothetical protein
MAVSARDVIDIAPEFIGVVLPDVISRFITRAETGVNRTAWGLKADLGVTYLAAHLVAVSRGAGKEGELSSTRHGAEFQRLLKQIPGFCTDYDGADPLYLNWMPRW